MEPLGVRQNLFSGSIESYGGFDTIIDPFWGSRRFQGGVSKLPLVFQWRAPQEENSGAVGTLTICDIILPYSCGVLRNGNESDSNTASSDTISAERSLQSATTFIHSTASSLWHVVGTRGSVNGVTVGFLYGAGAETLIFVTGTSGKYPKLFVSRQKNQSQLWIPRKQMKMGVWVSGAEIQTSAVDTRTAVWVSTPEKFSEIALGKKNSEFFSTVQGGLSASVILPFSKDQGKTTAI